MMQEIINQIIMKLQEIVVIMPPFLGALIGMSIIVLESMLPILPLGVFIALNVAIFGTIKGFLMSYVATILGCMLMYHLVRVTLRKHFRKKIDEINGLKQMMKRIDDISFSNLVLITALPFTPSFLINISCGLSRMKSKKFIANILISKIVIVYFWGYIGTTFLQSVTDVRVLIKLAVLLLIAYLLSRYVMKKNKLN